MLLTVVTDGGCEKLDGGGTRATESSIQMAYETEAFTDCTTLSTHRINTHLPLPQYLLVGVLLALHTELKQSVNKRLWSLLEGTSQSALSLV